MDKALPCNRCKTDGHLHFQYFDPPRFLSGPIYRVRCDLCGQTGPWERTRADAGKLWNELMEANENNTRSN